LIHYISRSDFAEQHVRIKINNKLRMKCRDDANTKFEALTLYFQEVLRKHTVIFTVAAFSVEVLTPELLNKNRNINN
jgi:hypothetical protein